MSRRVVWIGMALALAAGSLSGCGRGSGKTQLAFISNNPHGFWTYAQRGCEAAEKELNDKGFSISVDVRRPAAGNLEEQQRIMEELKVKGVKGIAISPNDASNMVTFLKNNIIDTITIVAVDNDIPDSKVRKVYVGTHNYRAGRAAGEMVAKVLPEGGKIAIFVGQMDAPNAIERRQGLLDYLAGKKQEEMTARDPADARNFAVGAYVLVDTRTDDAKEIICQEKAEDLLRTNPDVDCLVGLWEYNPPALLRAVRNSKLAKKPFIVGFDENFQTMDGIKSGEIVGSVAQNPYKFGYDSIKILAHLAKGDENILKEYKMDDQKRIYIDHTVVTRDNVEEFYANLKKLKGE